MDTAYAYNRWTDALAERLQEDGFFNVTVNNQGIGGNAVLSGGLGPPLLDRYLPDALEQTGVTHVMVFEGVNDIGGSAPDGKTQKKLFADLKEAYMKIVKDCKAQGLVTIGATITPFGNNTMYYHPAREATRKQVNEWILTSGTFDLTVDFSAALADGEQLRTEYDSGDFLHPNVAGYKELARNVPLDMFLG